MLGQLSVNGPFLSASRVHFVHIYVPRHTLDGDCLATGHVAVDVALGKEAEAISEVSGQPASAAVDGEVATESCTEDDAEEPWWAVDLGQQYDIVSVKITVPDSASDGMLMWWLYHGAIGPLLTRPLFHILY